MSNSYFQFKQFTVQQDKAAMKVSTDACIQGAWTPIADDVKHVLDIGAGTGLLSLMLAQRSDKIIIDAIELDEGAATQAIHNFASSQWTERLHLFQSDVRDFDFAKQYDMVICNPPFFQNSLLGDDTGRNNARHTLLLSYQDLFDVLKRAVKPTGYASVMLPAAEHLIWEELLTEGNYTIFKKLLVKPRNSFSPNRVISLCTVNMAQTKQPDEMLCIYNDDNSYTDEFSKLLNPFYLKL